MTKKHFKAIAQIIKKQPWQAHTCCIGRYIATDFAEYLQVQNPNFDKEKFLQACGQEQ